jgi:hypothetical protein
MSTAYEVLFVDVLYLFGIGRCCKNWTQDSMFASLIAFSNTSGERDERQRTPAADGAVMKLLKTWFV